MQKISEILLSCITNVQECDARNDAQRIAARPKKLFIVQYFQQLLCFSIVIITFWNCF